MIWLGWALACALGIGLVDVLSKRALQEFEPWIVGVARLGFALPALAVPLCWATRPVLTPTFWGTVAVMLPLEVIAFLCLLKALRVAPLAETVPFLCLSPLFTVLASWLILGERITWLGFLGICAIGAGGYLLYGHELRHGALGPLRAMARSEGTRLMVLVAVLYSVTSALGKQATLLAGPLIFPGLYVAALFVSFLLLQWLGGHRLGEVARAIGRRPGLLISIGVLDGLTFLMHSIGVLLAPVAYFLGVKRLSSVVSVVVGGLLFRDRHLRLRVTGVLCMVAGVFLLTLSVS